MTMKCITVYTNSYEAFSEVYEQILNENLAEYEEKEVEGITISDAGSVPEEYIERMRSKPDVAVMTIKRKGVTIFQHGDVFEMLIPGKEAVHV